MTSNTHLLARPSNGDMHRPRVSFTVQQCSMCKRMVAVPPPWHGQQPAATNNPHVTRARIDLRAHGWRAEHLRGTTTCDGYCYQLHPNYLCCPWARETDARFDRRARLCDLLPPILPAKRFADQLRTRVASPFYPHTCLCTCARSVLVQDFFACLCLNLDSAASPRAADCRLNTCTVLLLVLL